MAKKSKRPKDSRNTVIDANIGHISDTHGQVSSHHVQQQKRLQELNTLNWKEWVVTDGICYTNKEMDLSLLVLGSTTLNPTKSPQ